MMADPWSAITRGIWHADPTVAQVRADYAIARTASLILESALTEIREHVATYAVWQAGRIDPDALADSLCDHLRDVIPLPHDAVEDLL